MDRRSFLKLALASSCSLISNQIKILDPIFNTLSGRGKNILILLFDAWSAKNISLYRYSRDTTPNLKKLAEKAIVYHNHFAGGNATGPSTASFLTGVYPWNHRVFIGFSTSLPFFKDNNLFSLFPEYTRVAYSQNPIPNLNFDEMRENIDRFLVPHDSAVVEASLVDDLFWNDAGIAIKAELEAIGSKAKDLPNNLITSLITRYMRHEGGRDLQKIIRSDYPKGPPAIGFMKFLLEDTFDYLINILTEIEGPALSYFHFFPPHDPYRPRAEFIDHFKDDGYLPIEKPTHSLNNSKTQDFLNSERRIYDEFIANIDAEIGRLFKLLESIGYLDDTVVLLTSDHGEMFERGIFRHQTTTMYDPVAKIPLMIFEPGRTERLDIYDNTHTIDIIPTLLNLAGKEIPEWLEGEILPPYNPKVSLADRRIYRMESRLNHKYVPFDQATFSLINENYKFVHYYGHRDRTEVEDELFDLEADPEEINNLVHSKASLANKFREELSEKIVEADKPYK